MRARPMRRCIAPWLPLTGWPGMPPRQSQRRSSATARWPGRAAHPRAIRHGYSGLSRFALQHLIQRLPSSRSTRMRLFVFDRARLLAHKWRAAGGPGWGELHVLDPRKVGIEEIELHFSIATDLGLGAVGTFAFVPLQR